MEKIHESGAADRDKSAPPPAQAPRPDEPTLEPPSDDRLKPGGAHGSAYDVGMTGIDRDKIPSGADRDKLR